MSSIYLLQIIESPCQMKIEYIQDKFLVPSFSQQQQICHGNFPPLIQESFSPISALHEC